jgi:hypothetical protein
MADGQNGQGRARLTARVLDRLTAIRLRAHALRLWLGRGEPGLAAEAHAHLDAIDREVDEAAALVEDLRGPAAAAG